MSTGDAVAFTARVEGQSRQVVVGILIIRETDRALVAVPPSVLGCLHVCLSCDLVEVPATENRERLVGIKLTWVRAELLRAPTATEASGPSSFQGLTPCVKSVGRAYYNRQNLDVPFEWGTMGTRITVEDPATPSGFMPTTGVPGEDTTSLSQDTPRNSQQFADMAKQTFLFSTLSGEELALPLKQNIEDASVFDSTAPLPIYCRCDDVHELPEETRDVDLELAGHLARCIHHRWKIPVMCQKWIIGRTPMLPSTDSFPLWLRKYVADQFRSGPIKSQDVCTTMAEVFYKILFHEVTITVVVTTEQVETLLRSSSIHEPAIEALAELVESGRYRQGIDMLLDYVIRNTQNPLAPREVQVALEALTDQVDWNDTPVVEKLFQIILGDMTPSRFFALDSAIGVVQNSLQREDPHATFCISAGDRREGVHIDESESRDAFLVGRFELVWSRLSLYRQEGANLLVARRLSEFGIGIYRAKLWMLIGVLLLQMCALSQKRCSDRIVATLQRDFNKRFGDGGSYGDPEILVPWERLTNWPWQREGSDPLLQRVVFDFLATRLDGREDPSVPPTECSNAALQLIKRLYGIQPRGQGWKDLDEDVRLYAESQVKSWRSQPSGSEQQRLD
jgi:hypothetical protein